MNKIFAEQIMGLGLGEAGTFGSVQRALGFQNVCPIREGYGTIQFSFRHGRIRSAVCLFCLF